MELIHCPRGLREMIPSLEALRLYAYSGAIAYASSQRILTLSGFSSKVLDENLLGIDRGELDDTGSHSEACPKTITLTKLYM